MRLSRSEPGLVVSAAAHAGLLLATLVAFSDARKFDDAQEAVPVDMVTDSQFNQVMKGEKTAKDIKAAQRVDKVAEASETKPAPPLAEAKRDVEAPPPPVKRQEAQTSDAPEAPPPPKRVAALPPAPEPPARPVQPAPQQPAKPQAKAAPAPEDDKPEDAEIVRPKPPTKPKLDKEAKEGPKPPEKPKPKDEPRLKVDEVAKLLEQKKLAEKQTSADTKEDKTSDKPPAKPRSGDETAPKSKFNAASIASLLSHEAPQRRASTGRETQTASLGAPNASASRMSPTLQAQIDAYTVDHYRKCWQASLSMNARTYVPRVEFRLTRDGALEGPPRLLNPSSDPVERSRGEQALGAVRRCSPMPIPATFAPYYDYWRVTELDMREDM